MSDDPAYILDVSSLTPGGDTFDPATENAGANPGSQAGDARPWIGIHFECCGVYVRIYRNREATAYEGRCPRCARPVRIRIGPGGTGHRMFRAE